MSRQKTNRTFRNLGTAAFGVGTLSAAAAFVQTVGPVVIDLISTVNGTLMLGGLVVTTSLLARHAFRDLSPIASPTPPLKPAYTIRRLDDDVYLDVAEQLIGPYTGPTAEEHARLDGDLLTRVTDVDIDEAFASIPSRLLATAEVKDEVTKA